MAGPDLRSCADELRRAAVAAVEPAAAVHRHLRREGDALVVAGRSCDLGAFERVLLVGGGKATVPVLSAVADILGERVTAAVGVTKYGHTAGLDGHTMASLRTLRDLQLIEAGHPIPDENSVRGAQTVADLVSNATERDLILCLFSGGGSALLTLPVPGLDLAGLQTLTDALLRSGATIQELNTVRKHCTRLKGGDLARLAAPATVITLVLSDVVGDPLDVIASGPTMPDPTTPADAQAVLDRYGIRPADPVPFQETLKPGHPAFDLVQHVIIGSNRLAALAAVGRARELGFNTLLLGTYLEGEAREVAQAAAALAKSVRANGDPVAPPACLVWGGETTVRVRGAGKGGRNTELALAAAIALDGWPGVLVMALATDGSDGPTDAAGAVATGETAERARALGLEPWAMLEANDSYSFFAALGDLVRSGPTGTNVNDLVFILAGPEDGPW